MKKILWIFASVLLLSSLFVSTGCGDDEGTGTDLSPLVILKTGDTENVVVGPNATVSVTVEATKGTNPLKSLTVLENNVKVNLDRLSIDGSAAAANPVLIVSPTDVMTWTITIVAHDDFDERLYTVRVEDDKGLSDEVEFKINVIQGIEETITGATIRLWNAAGPVGRGGIDLDNGQSTGTRLTTSGDDSYLAAELRDMGIDSLAGSGDNWRRRVAGINGTDVRFLGNVSSLTDFNFDNIDTKETIEKLFDEANNLTGTLPTWGSFKVSQPVSVGDVFVVRRNTDGRHYLVEVESIFETTALADNEDYYRVSIKY